MHCNWAPLWEPELPWWHWEHQCTGSAGPDGECHANCRVTAIADGLAAEGGTPGAARAPSGSTTRSGRTRSSTAAASRPRETSGDADTAYQQAMRKWQVDMRSWQVHTEAPWCRCGS